MASYSSLASLQHLSLLLAIDVCHHHCVLKYAIIIFGIVENDGIMMLPRCGKMELSSNYQKRCDVGQHFWFCCIWIMWWRCVVHPWHMTDDIFLYNILQYLQWNQLQTLFLLIPTFLFFWNLWMLNTKELFPLWKNFRKCSDIKDLQCKSKTVALQNHWGESPPCFPLIVGNFSFFIFQSLVSS